MKKRVLVIALLLSKIILAQKEDTVFLFQKPGQKIFIEPTKNIEQYKQLTDFGLEDSLNFYIESIQSFKKRGLKFHKFNFGNFPKQWVSIKYYKDSFYAYSYSDFYFDFKLAIADSFFIDDIEGPYAEEILSYKKINDSTFSFLITQHYQKPKKITYYIIDRKRNIAVVEISKEGDKNYLLMVDAKKLSEFKIINNYTENKEHEFDFDLPDYDKLTNGRTQIKSKRKFRITKKL